MTAGFLVTFGVRGTAIKFGWSLPVCRRRESAGKMTARPRRETYERSAVAELFDLAIERRLANPELLGGLTPIAAHGSKH